jgi:hypothetical protein
MTISRRFFLKTGSLTALAVGVVSLGSDKLIFGHSRLTGSGPGFPIPAGALQQAVRMFTRATFEPLVGEMFAAPDAQGNMVGLKLLKVTPYKPSAATKLSTRAARDTDSFSLSFKAGGRLPEFTSMHKVSHPTLGEFDLFLKPSTVKGAWFYEAVFHHI